MREDITKKKIQSLCPDVMEKKMGCLIHLKDDANFPDYFGLYAGKFYVHERSKYVELVLHGDGKLFPIDEAHNVRGSPITLSVVLRAIQKIPSTKFDDAWFVDTEGFFVKAAHRADLERDKEAIAQLTPTVKWNLTKDNYDDQSEETKNFIGSLLTNII